MTRSKVRLFFAGLAWLACSPGFAQTAASANAALTSYEQLIGELQSGTPGTQLNMKLSEAYFGLGISLQALARHAEAVVAFDNALQALRQNQGLYALEQIQVLQAQLDSRQALASWQDVDAGMQLAYLITLRNRDAGPEHRYQALREFGLWKLRAAEEELLPDVLTGTRDAAALYRQELERPELRRAYESRPLALANLYLDLAALEFLEARKKLELPLSEYVTGGQRTVSQMFCETIQTPDGRARQVCRNLQVPNMDYFMALSDRKYEEVGRHLDATEDAVLEAYAVLRGEVETHNRADALALLSEVHRLTDAHNDFTAANARRTGSRIAAPTGSRINR